MPLHNRMPILEALDRLQIFCPIKVYFNNFELYNDNPDNETESGVYSEAEPLMIAVPKRLKTTLDNYDILVTRFEVLITQYHHSIVYMHGEKIIKE